MTGYWLLDWALIVLLVGGVLRLALDADLALELSGLYDRWHEWRARRAFARRVHCILRTPAQRDESHAHYGAGEPEED